MSEESAHKELSKLEEKFALADEEVMKLQNKLYKPILEERKAVLKSIPKFWPMVLEQYGEAIEKHITPDDQELLETIESIEVERDDDDIRSFEIKFVFGNNEFLEQTEITKKFKAISKHGQDIKYESTPVEIKWKTGKDLTKREKGAAPSFFDFFAFKGDDKEMFPEAEEIAASISEDLYPNAAKYYVDAIKELYEDEDESDISLSEEDEDEDEENNESDAIEEPPQKKLRSE
ncbi:hypothetical protein CANCADRAFT_30461 [Tortispora caseinolytica NRRL Y-17796]|uniref:Nucleosome assembly protein n=1 Tax=Tortispora caseinolytica NRRL Y-17796 TaxID=767744 RepID=A0A1E4TKG1_9ASCO|nr:hypothetical protein CANCADRAFT_30461 [Tortispora caseinolytica NRRL Y-17796]